MIIAKIRNRYMYHVKTKDYQRPGEKFSKGRKFPKSEAKQEHTYVVYYDKPSKKFCAVTTTHLYYPDNKRMRQVQSGIYKKIMLPCFETPSGIYHKSMSKNSAGGDIKLTSKDVRIIGKVPDNDSKKILRFLNRKKKHSAK